MAVMLRRGAFLFCLWTPILLNSSTKISWLKQTGRVHSQMDGCTAMTMAEVLPHVHLKS